MRGSPVSSLALLGTGNGEQGTGMRRGERQRIRKERDREWRGRKETRWRGGGERVEPHGARGVGGCAVCGAEVALEGGHVGVDVEDACLRAACSRVSEVEAGTGARRSVPEKRAHDARAQLRLELSGARGVEERCGEDVSALRVLHSRFDEYRLEIE